MRWGLFHLDDRILFVLLNKGVDVYACNKFFHYPQFLMYSKNVQGTCGHRER